MYDVPTIGELVRNPQINADELSVYSGGTDKAFHKLMAEVGVETTAFKMRTDPEYRAANADTALGKVFKSMGLDMATFDISSSATPNLIEEATNLLLGPRRPDAIGEMLHTSFPMEKETQRFPFFNKTGKSQKTTRGINDINTRGDRHVWIDFKANLELLTGDQVDLKFKEDNNSQTIAHWAGSIGTQHFEDLSQECVNRLVLADANFAAGAAGNRTATDDSGNTVSKGLLSTPTTALSFDGIAKAISDARSAHWAPDCALMNHTAMYTLLVSTDFKDADKFQAMADYNGLTIPSIFNVKLFATSQVASTNNAVFWMWEKARYSFFLIRRYALVNSWENKETLKEGMNYSTRYGFAIGDGAAILKCKNA